MPINLKHGWSISRKGASDLASFTSNMDRYSFVEILAPCFFPFARREYGHNFIYHQDNDPKHTSFIASQIF